MVKNLGIPTDEEIDAIFEGKLDETMNLLNEEVFETLK